MALDLETLWTIITIFFQLYPLTSLGNESKVQVVLVGLDVLLGQDQLVDLQGGPELFEEGETLPDSEKTGQTLRNLTRLYFVQSNRYDCTYYS